MTLKADPRVLTEDTADHIVSTGCLPAGKHNADLQRLSLCRLVSRHQRRRRLPEKVREQLRNLACAGQIETKRNVKMNPPMEGRSSGARSAGPHRGSRSQSWVARRRGRRMSRARRGAGGRGGGGSSAPRYTATPGCCSAMSRSSSPPPLPCFRGWRALDWRTRRCGEAGCVCAVAGFYARSDESVLRITAEWR
jgi:hypothetical protein